MKNWITFFSGLALLITGIILFFIGEKETAAVCILAGVGIMAAKQSNVTGVGSDAKTKKEIEAEKE